MYEEALFDLFGRNSSSLIKRIKGAFAHVQAQFCHKSLGTKIHVNVQNADEPILLPTGTKQAEITVPTLKADTSTHLMVVLAASTGGGFSNTGSPCATKFNRISYNGRGCRPGVYGGVIRCSNVSVLAVRGYS